MDRGEAHRVQRGRRAARVWLSGLFPAWAAAAALVGAELPVRLDCSARECPALEIDGDAISRYPNGRPAAFRGFADPCLRRDPATGTLWMVYSGRSSRRSTSRGHCIGRACTLERCYPSRPVGPLSPRGRT
jgi:hypothetical protein